MVVYRQVAASVIADIRDGSPIFGRLTGAAAPIGYIDFRTLIWCDGTNGNDVNDGLRVGNAVATITYSVTLTTANKDDIVLVLKGNYDENANVGGAIVNKAGIHIIGLGKYQCKVLNSNGAATSSMLISANSIEVVGFYFNENTSTVEDIYSTSDYLHIHHNTFVGACENHIHCDGSYGSIIEWNSIYSGTNDGIELTGSLSYNNIIRYNYISGALDNSIHLNGDQVDNNLVYNNWVNGQNGVTDVLINIVDGDNNMVVGNYGGGWGTAPYTNSGSNNIWINEWEPVEVTSSLVYDVSEIDATTANADTKIIAIDNATYLKYKCSKIFIDISSWNSAYGAGKVLTAEMKMDVQGGAPAESLKPKTYTQGTDTETILVVDDWQGVEDVDIYVYCDDETGGDFTIYYTYILTPI